MMCILVHQGKTMGCTHSWDKDPTNQKEGRKLNDTYLGRGGEGNMRRKGQKRN
jgi:hypothetical protein